MNKWLIMLLSTLLVTLSGPRLSWAELATQDQMPYVTLIDSFKLYSSSETRANEVIGSLSALQSVQMVPIERNELLNITRMYQLPVATWLGTAWINLKEGAYKFGRLEFQDHCGQKGSHTELQCQRCSGIFDFYSTKHQFYTFCLWDY
jgi:hypothetical protein